MRRAILWILPMLLGLGLTALAGAEVQGRTIEYTVNGQTMRGYLAFDDSFEGPRPGVLVFPEWWGLNDFAREKARQLAQLGYLALAADIYGQGQTTESAEQARELAGRFYGDRRLLRERARGALEVLRSQAMVIPERVGAIGFCFGGSVALELARSGADLPAIVSFHGGLATPLPARPGQIQGAILVLHGADDPHVPPADLLGFMREMRDADADWQVNVYGGAVHAFMNPDAGDDPASGSAYDAQAAQRAWQAMKLFFADTIGLRAPSGDEEDGVWQFLRTEVGPRAAEVGREVGGAAQEAGEKVWDWVTD